MADAETRLRRSRARLSRVADDETDLAIRVGSSVASLLHGHVDQFASLQREYRDWFCDERLELLQPGLGAIDLMVTVGQHLSGTVMRRVPDDERTPRIHALIELQALAVLLSNEIIDLLRGGWPAAAEARWRTLHETEVIALFLAKAPQTVSRRYLDSLDVDMDRLLRRRLIRLSPGHEARAIRQDFSDRSATAVAAHGAAIKHEYGWAAKWLRRKRVRFADLEKRVAPRRPAYVSASNRVHAGRIGALFSLLDGPNRVFTGRRSDGLTDAALQTLWSANTVTAALLGAIEDHTGDTTFWIWDEVQTELAGEADVQLRRGEMTRLRAAGNAARAEAYMSPLEANLIRMTRDVASPGGSWE